jgi:hypothetical protein
MGAMGIPWWGWVLGIVVVGLVVFVGSWKYYRTNIRNQFLAYLAAEHPELKIGEVTSDSVVITTEEGGEGTLFLDRLYSESHSIEVDDEDAHRELFARFAGTIIEGQGALSVDADRDRDRVFPRIVRSDWAEEAAKQVGSDPLPSLPLGPEGLDVVFVLDNENSVAYLQSEQLTDLGISPEDALDLAKENLGRSFRPEAIRPVLDESAMSVVKSEDTYDAARLLLIPGALRDGESIAALIPDRDTLVLTPVPEDGDWASLAKLAKSPDGDPLWTEPLVVTSTGVSAVEW